MARTASFEKTLLELETIVTQLEQGELTLDESLKQFEKGVSLARKCQDTLNQAQQTIERLAEVSQTKDRDDSLA